MFPAARIGDATTYGAVTSGSSNVLINNIPAGVANMSTASSSLTGTTTIVKGSGTVFINQLPAARQNDACADGGNVTCGSGNVIIGG